MPAGLTALKDSEGFRDGGTGGYRAYHFSGGRSAYGRYFRGSLRRYVPGTGTRVTASGAVIFTAGMEEPAGRRGADLNTEITVSFDEAAFGADKVLHFRREDGSTQSLQVHIPAGIDQGQSIRLRGKGMPGSGGGEAGDLMMKVHIEEKPGFTRKGIDLYSAVTIPFTTAVFGGEAVVQTLGGSVICKIRKGTQSGSRIRLKGKGIVSMKDPSVHGDQYVTVQVQVPRDLSPEAEQKLREFEAACRKSGRRWSAA